MARIAVTQQDTILKINSFLGLNENPDGDTTLKDGELSEMRNFKITQDGHLQIRPGTKKVLSLYDALTALGGTVPAQDTLHTRGAWRGVTGGTERIVAAYGGHLWCIDVDGATAVEIGTENDFDTTFFGFDDKVYMLNGYEYMSWDGDITHRFENVLGYAPLVQISTTPGGDGTTLEPVNRMNGNRRVQFSPDGVASAFQLPETWIDEVLGVTVNGLSVTYTASVSAGTVTLTTPPAAGTNTMEVTYRKGIGQRLDFLKMRFAELYNGSTDTRVFLYGDGTNKAIYSGVRYDTGKPSADYFPDLYEVAVGDSNTELTALVRHYSRLMAFKPNSAWVIQYGDITLADGSVTAAFYVQPVNRQFGNEAKGQVRLLENNPLTFDVGSIYRWKNVSNYGSYTVSGDSNAERISDRVVSTLKEISFDTLKTYNLNLSHEFWIVDNGVVLILNYSNNCWYVYRDLPVVLPVETETDCYGFGDNGDLHHLSRAYRNDNGVAIDCYAATGSMDFSRDWIRKFSPVLFVAMQPEAGARIYVTAESNRRSDYPDKVVAYSLATFLHVDFGHFSFGTNSKPQVKRVRMKVKKATFYKLVFKSNSASATATIIETDIRLRYGGTVK